MDIKKAKQRRLNGGRFTGWKTSYCRKEGRCLFIMKGKKRLQLSVQIAPQCRIWFSSTSSFFLFSGFLTRLSFSPFSSFTFFNDLLSFLFFFSYIPPFLYGSLFGKLSFVFLLLSCDRGLRRCTGRLRTRPKVGGVVMMKMVGKKDESLSLRRNERQKTQREKSRRYESFQSQSQIMLVFLAERSEG